MGTFNTINPATEEVIKEWTTMTESEVMDILAEVEHGFKSWKELDVEHRAPYFVKLAEVLRENAKTYAEHISLEMGKPIKDALAEIEKCAVCAEVYSKEGPKWLAEEEVKADGVKHYVRYEPTGVVFSIMPWNFPFWQAMRFGIPTMLAGNVSILKHASNVSQCAMDIEEAFTKAGFPKGVFRTIIADHQTVAKVMEHDFIAGVSLTGSTSVGARIAETAGKNLKKVVLELGGSDPFIVLDDVDVEVAATNAVLGRAQNCGQSCIAAKRFIVMKEVAEEFSKAFAEKMKELSVGDPMEESTQMGPLVNKQALDEITEQVEDAVAKGGEVLAGGKRIGSKGFFFEPTVISNTTPEMKIVCEETFGPVAAIIVVESEDEAIEIANNSEFGLAGSVWTKDLKRGQKVASRVESGAVFVNSISKSDTRMPFGGVKKSGIGRELSKYGIREFVNVKGYSVYEHK